MFVDGILSVKANQGTRKTDGGVVKNLKPTTCTARFVVVFCPSEGLPIVSIRKIGVKSERHREWTAGCQKAHARPCLAEATPRNYTAVW